MNHEIIFVILALIFGFLLTWGVGANDLANVLSPTIGSKAINLRQALIIALIFELGGALLGGGKVATTVQSGIVDTTVLIATPNILIYGMLAALLASSIWITTASHLGIPVSLTNSIVGSVIGFGALILGWHAVHWKMVGFIGLCWVLCPLTAGFIAFLLFTLIKNKILTKEEPLSQAKKYLPFFLFVVGFVLSELTIIKGLRHFNIHPDLTDNILIATATGFIIVLIGNIFLKRIYRSSFLDYKEQFALVEKAFSIIMMFTASAMVYAHGSDDISTASGPVAAVVNLAQTQFAALHKNSLLMMILAFGYLGVVSGFLLHGHKVVQTVGSRITELTPSRAFCATLAAACTVVTSTNIGIPVSATQTLVGAILGVGFARGIGALDLKIAQRIFASWFITIPITAILTTIFFYIFKLLFNH